MNFGDAINTVVGITKRPEKLAETKAAINRAIELYVKAANWAADLVELSVDIDPNLYAQSFIIADELTNFRKICYISPFETTKYLTFVAPDKIFQPDGCEQINAWYRAGGRIVFKLGTLNSKLNVGYYRYWSYLINNTDTHWMLDVMPSVVTDKAISEIFDSIGADSEARRYAAYARDGFAVSEADLADGESRV